MMVAITLAVVAAACIGTADFLAGVVGKRDPSNSALTISYVVVLLAAAPLAAAVDGMPTTSGFGWGAAMGITWVIGIFALARGMSQGRVVLVVPIAGVLSAAIPALVDLIAGARPSPVVGAGVVVGFLAVALTGIGSEDERSRSATWSVAHGAVAGVTTGLSLVLIDQAAESGLWPLVSGAAIAAVVMVCATLFAGHALVPPRSAVVPAAVMGLLIAGAFVAMMIAFPRGSLTVVAVIVSQYPAVTILLAAALWQQRPRGVQYVGVALTMVAVALIAVG